MKTFNGFEELKADAAEEDFFTAQSAVHSGKMLRIFCGRQIAAPLMRG